MKKIVLGICIVSSIVLVGILFNDFQVSDNVLLANVEALANPENEGGWFREDKDCEYTYKNWYICWNYSTFTVAYEHM